MRPGDDHPQVSAEVRRFLAAHVSSVPFLEAALLLRAEPHVDWSAQRLAARLYIAPREALGLLRALQDAGLAVRLSASAFTYTRDPDRASIMDAVAQAYSAHLREVTELIHARLDRRARVFADAFKLRKD